METQEVKKRGRKKIAKLPEEEEEKKEEIITEPKKRGRKKKESNELIQQIQDMKIEDFEMQEEEEKKSEVEEITKGIESIQINEDKERNERREIKSKRIQRVIGEPKEDTYYLYLIKRRLEPIDEKGMYYEYDKEKIEKTVFIYQVLVYGSYENEMILYPIEREELIHEDEIELIEGRQTIKIRILPERSIKKIQKEIEQDKWKILMLQYRMPKIGKVTDREICKRILEKDHMFVGSEKRPIHNTEILNRHLYFFESESLILSHLTLKDIFEKFSKME
jgi:hypothetical protein